MKNAPIQTTNESALDSAIIANKPKQSNLFPELLNKPLEPLPGTLAARALWLLREQIHGITHPDFQRQTGSWRLSAVIFDLKEMGWPIESMRVNLPGWQRRCISRYWLED